MHETESDMESFDVSVLLKLHVSLCSRLIISCLLRGGKCSIPSSVGIRRELQLIVSRTHSVPVQKYSAPIHWPSTTLRQGPNFSPGNIRLPLRSHKSVSLKMLLPSSSEWYTHMFNTATFVVCLIVLALWLILNSFARARVNDIISSAVNVSGGCRCWPCYSP